MRNVSAQKLSLFLLLFILINCSRRSSDETTTSFALCNYSNLHKITVPQYHGFAGSATFEYYYQHKQVSTGAPTVIVLPGGPGSLSINSSLGHIPSDYNIIYTDPRGCGCNANPTGALYPIDFYSTEFIVRDILAIIKNLNLTNYAIYGKSFGTVLATRLTYLIEAEGITKPNLVILEGTLGKAYSNFTEYLAGSQTQWTRAQAQIDTSVLNNIKNNSGFLGYTSQQWSSIIITLISFGEVPGAGMDLLSVKLNNLTDPNSAVGKETKAYLDQIAFPTSTEAIANKNRISMALGCKELWGTFTGFDLVSGQFVGSGVDVCSQNGLSLSNAYDSVNFKVRTPILYFNGDNDPNTPMSQAQYHYNNQTKTNRSFVTVVAAGHSPLDFTLNNRGCTDALWNAMLTNESNFVAALNSCSWTMALNSLAATE